MPVHARKLEHDERPRKHQLRVVEAPEMSTRSTADVVEVVGFALMILASWFIAAALLVPELSGLL